MNNDEIKTDKSQLYAGIVWVFSALALAIYGVLFILDSRVPGVPELLSFLAKIEPEYIYLSAFVLIFIEGLYFVGSFFPGASSVVIIAIVSGASGYSTLFMTLILVFLGWSLAGTINIYSAKIYRNKIVKLHPLDEYPIKDRVWTTWFPAFRSSYEVAQVVEGGRPIKVFISSLRVRFWATVLVGCLALIIPLLLDINKLSDREGLITIILVFGISLFVGLRKIKNYFKPVIIAP